MDADSSAPQPASGLEREPPLGAHLATSRHGYAHHGLYVGHGKVVHYAGLSRSWRPGLVEEVTISEFAFGHPVRIVDHSGSRYSPQEIVQRARSRLGEDNYNLLTNNCGHFCNWCIDDRPGNPQFDRPTTIRSLVSCLAVIVFAGVVAAYLPRLRT
jgi:HRAS-like suppressor 3